MDAGFRTPLLDLFRRGEVARDIRMLAAQGVLAPRAHEQLGLLVLLVEDEDPEVARAAEVTLQAIPHEALAAFLARSDVSTEMRGFFARRGIEPAESAAAAPDGPLVVAPNADEFGAAEAAGAGEADTDVEKVSTLNKIAAMNVAQRIALAMKGSREERAILIRDPSKIVAVAVLSSPRITESEVEAIARMANVSDEILRIIAHTRAWIKNYPVVVALTKNPKTPLALSMNLLPRLNDRDLRMLSSDRNIPDVLRISARKKVVFDK
jgi:hypothetical protein